MPKNIYKYVKGYDNCQRRKLIPKYHITLHLPISTLFDVISIDLAGPCPCTPSGKKFFLVAIEHLTGWPIAISTDEAAALTVIAFMRKEIIYNIFSPRFVFSDNATCFLATTLQIVMKEYETKWKAVLAYTSMSNGKAKRMVGTLKRAVACLITNGTIPSGEALYKVVYGYRRRRASSGLFSFELMSVHPPRVVPIEFGALSSTQDETARAAETIAKSGLRASRALQKQTQGEKFNVKKLSVGSLVLLSQGTAIQQSVKWPDFQSKSIGPYKLKR